MRGGGVRVGDKSATIYLQALLGGASVGLCSYWVSEAIVHVIK